MLLLYSLKTTCAAAVIAVTELLAHGHILVALAAVPMLALMWHATTLYARRRAREGVR